jgi:hypothetical protein
MTLTLLAMGGVYLWDQLPDATAMEPSAKSWTLATRSSPAFAVSLTDSRDKTEAYEIFRHPEGGRKDVFRWTDADQKSIAELEIYRPGGEATEAEPPSAEIAVRMDPNGARELEAAGIIDSKFGTVTLLRPVSSDAAASCLGFVKRVDKPNFGLDLSRQHSAGPARRHQLHVEPPDPAHCWERPEAGRIVRPRRTQAQQLRNPDRAGTLGRLGDGSGEPAAARRPLMARSRQHTGFHKTFASLAALLWPGVAQLT